MIVIGSLFLGCILSVSEVLWLAGRDDRSQTPNYIDMVRGAKNGKPT